MTAERINNRRKRSAISKILDSIFRKANAIPLLLIVTIILLREPLIKLINKYWVNPVVSLVERSLFKDIIFFIIIVGVIMYYYRKKKNFLPDIRLVIYSLLVSTTYVCFRFSPNSPWIFTPLKTFSCIIYTDIFLVTGTISSIYAIQRLNKLFQPKTDLPPSMLFNDVPIPGIKEDELGYKTYASNIANMINNSQFHTAFAIGITSKWGGGKTSFFNMIKSGLQDDSIVIDFNPWRSTNAKAIIKDFFQTVQNELSPYSSQLSIQILGYAEKLLALNDSQINKTGKAFLSEFSDDSAHILFDRINTTLQLLNKRILIFIDDIDRLDKEEVFEVIRLIRNTANFYNCFFVVAYDRSYILHTLKSLDIHHYENFLEKIFQLEVTLPYFDKTILIDRFTEKLHQILPQQKKQDIEDVILRSGDDGNRILFTEWNTTVRDVTRLLNSIRTNIQNVSVEIELVDFIRIEMLRFKYPSVYEVLFKESDKFLSSTDFNFSTNSEKKPLHLIRKKEETNSKGGKLVLEEYLTENTNRLSIPKHAIADIVFFIEELFEGRLRISYYNRSVPTSHLSIRNKERFHLYFSYGVISGVLSEEEFLHTLTQPVDTILNQIDTWIERKLEDKISKRFQDLDNELHDYTTFERMIKANFYLANQESRIYKNGRIGYDFSNMYNKLLPSGKIMRRLSALEGSTKYSKVIRSIFENPRSDHYYEAQFLKEMSNSSWKYEDFQPIMSAQETEQYLVDYLKKICVQEQKLTSTVWHYNRCCITPHLISILYPGTEVHNKSALPEAQKLFIDFITNKDLDSFLRDSIQVDHHHSSGFQINTLGNDIFGSPQKFESFLYNQDEIKWKYLEEYKRFYELTKEEQSFIEFDFKTISFENT